MPDLNIETRRNFFQVGVEGPQYQLFSAGNLHTDESNL